MLAMDHPRFRAITKLIDNRELREAILQLDTLLDRLSPENRPAALYWKIVCLLQLGEVKQAKRYIEKLLSEEDVPHSLRICLELQNAYVQVGEQGPELGGAPIRSVLDRYAKQFSTPDFFWQHIDAQRHLGVCLARAKRYSEAITELELALSRETRPGAQYRIHLWVSDAYYRSGDLNKAKDHLERALTAGESAPKAQLPADYPALIRFQLAWLAYQQHRLTDAENELKLASAAARNPETQKSITKLRTLLDQASSI